MAPSRSLRHVLLDADGVVQDAGGAFAAELGVLGPDVGEWLLEVFRPDGAVLTGRQEVVPLLAERLRSLGRTVDADDDAAALYANVWERGVEVHRPVLDLVAGWRARGLGVHLVTNQDLGRARWMQRELGYDRLFDRTYYSCDLGVAKPSAGYFTHVLDDLGADPAETLFVDDSAANVAGAAALGLRTLHWTTADGVDLLRDAVG